MLYRHVQPLFLSADYSVRPVRGPRLKVRPLDSDAPDHLMRFVLWGAIHDRAGQAPAPTRKADPKAPDPSVTPDPSKAPDVVVVTAPSRPKLLIEMSPDGEGWVVQSTLEPRERPYLVTVSHMLPFVRVRLDTNGVEARAYALVMANAPFQLDGGDPVIRDPTQPSGGKR